MGKKRRWRDEGPRPSSGAREAVDVERLLVVAAEAHHTKNTEALARARSLLERALRGPHGLRLVDDAVAAALGRAIQRSWATGWQPVDVVRVAGRLGDRHRAALSRDAIAADMADRPVGTVHPSWRDQLAELDATRWWDDGEPHLSQWARRSSRTDEEALASTVGLLAMLHHLPGLPLLCPPPGAAGGPGQPGAGAWAGPRAGSSPQLERIRALLDKAESTTFPEEAEALSAKAQELMAAHSIDRIAVTAAGEDRPIGRRIGIENPYAAPKSLLLDKVAAANRCRSVWTPDVGFATVFGDEDDVGSVELLFTSLLAQAAGALRIADRRRQAERAGRARSFRQSFYLGYALRIGARLAEAADAMQAEAEAERGAGLVPVLAGHAKEVDEAVDAAYPGLVRRSVSSSNRTGWASGIAAAEAATLGVRREVGAARDEGQASG